MPADTLRAEPPSHKRGASNVITGLTLIFCHGPTLQLYEVQSLQGVASVSILPSTEWPACLAAATAAAGPSRLMLLSRWTFVAKLGYLLVDLQHDAVKKVPLVCIAIVLPLCQQRRILCNGWTIDLLCPCMFRTWQTALFLFLDRHIGCLTPLVAKSITEPSNRLIAL